MFILLLTTDNRPEDREAEISALSVAYDNWSEQRSMSKDATHATKVLGAMLRKVSRTTSRKVPSDSRKAGKPAGSGLRQPSQPTKDQGPDLVPPQQQGSEGTGTISDGLFRPRVPTVLPEFLRRGDEALGFQNRGLLSNVGCLDFSDEGAESVDFGNLDSLIDSIDIDWVSDSPNALGRPRLKPKSQYPLITD